MQNKRQARVVVFASSIFSQYLLGVLAQKQRLVGVVLPDPAELTEHTSEITTIAMQLQQVGIPYQYCCKAKLPLIHQQFKAWRANVGIIAAYPHILPSELLDYFTEPESLGIYNLHASRLPEYPGPQPLYWQIRNGETDTALVLHHAQVKADSGDVVAEQVVDIDPHDTLPSLTNRLAEESVKLTIDWLATLLKESKPLVGTLQPPLIASQLGQKYAYRPNTEDLYVNFESMNAQQIRDMCRAGNGSMYAALIVVKGISVSLLQATPVATPTYGTKAGTVVFVGEPEGLIVCVKDGAIRLDILATSDGVFTGFSFTERFQLDAGTCLVSVSSSLKKLA